jgi:hypothetical protein
VRGELLGRDLDDVPSGPFRIILPRSLFFPFDVRFSIVEQLPMTRLNMLTFCCRRKYLLPETN